MALVTAMCLGKCAALRATPAVQPVTTVALVGDAALPANVQMSIAAGAPPKRDVFDPSSFHAGPAHSDRMAGTGPIHPQLVWSTAVGGPVEAEPVASPDLQHLYVSTLAGELYALTRADGRVQWKSDLGGRAYATPLVAADGTIYAGSDAHRIVAFAPDGTVRWKLEVPGEVDTAFLALPGNDIAVAAGKEMYAVHPNGVVAWRFEAGGKIFTAPALAGNRVVFGAQDDRAYAVGLDGRLAWSVNLGADVDGSPAVTDDGDVLFGTDQGAVVRVSQDGRVLWKTPLDGYVRGGLSIARNGDALAGMYGPTPAVVRLDARDGHLIGRFGVDGTGAREFGVHGAPLEDDRGALFFGAQDDRVYAIGPDGARMWIETRGGDVDAPLTLLPNGDLIVAADDGTVALYRDAR